MRDQKVPRLSKWPFFVAQLMALGLALFICLRPAAMLTPTVLALAVLAVIAGTAVWVIPFLMEYQSVSRLAESALLSEVSTRLRDLEQLAAQINSATAQWNVMQAEAEKTTAGARGIADRMTAETRGFMEFMQRANDTEKATLRLEVEKLRRAEADWLQVLVRMMDHVYALHQGALRSGQPNVAEQVGNFQNACREAVRRVGLSPIVAGRAEPYDGQRHQLAEGESQGPNGNARVAETVAAGYTFQGKLIRPALVRLEKNGNVKT